MPVYLPDVFYNVLRVLKHRAKRHAAVNLLGDRDVEWSWISSQMPAGPGEALDFGNDGTMTGLIAVQRGFNVTAVDLTDARFYYEHTRFRFLRGDILKLSLPREHFDLVINCSTVEHVGLAGRYGVVGHCPDGDLEAMVRLKELLKPQGLMLLTVPVGRDAVFAPMSRIYGIHRLPRLLEGYRIEKEAFWVKNSRNKWVSCSKGAALDFKTSAGSGDMLKDVYALGCFVLALKNE